MRQDDHDDMTPPALNATTMNETIINAMTINAVTIDATTTIDETMFRTA
jgi:hypothetical protein